MRPDTLFSVVIAAFNSQGTVASAVRSALTQTDARQEVIVVDDGSSDATASVVEQIADPRVRLIRQPNRGSAAARNAGIAVARGSYIAFLDADDLWLPTYLASAQRALCTANAGIAYTDAYAFDGSSGRVRRQTAMHWWQPPTPFIDADAFLLALLGTNFIYNSVSVPRSVLDHVGGFDEDERTYEDYELWLRIVRHGYLPVRMAGVQALYRLHPGQKSRDPVSSARSLLAVLNGIPIEALPTAEHRSVLTRRRQSAALDLRVVTGHAPLVRVARMPRRLVATMRRNAGMSESWFAEPPAQVAAAFPDLTEV